VSSLAVNRHNPDVIAVGYGSLRFGAVARQGYIMCWSLKNPRVSSRPAARDVSEPFVAHGDGIGPEKIGRECVTGLSVWHPPTNHGTVTLADRCSIHTDDLFSYLGQTKFFE